MLRIGAHMSVSGGVSKAVERARLHGCEALQIFTKNASQRSSNPLVPSEGAAFRARIETSGIHPGVSHASHLINLATTSDTLSTLSLETFIDELDRAEILGLLGVVIHPGTCPAGSEEAGLRLLAGAIQRALDARP